MIFDDLGSLAGIVVVGVLGYAALVVFLRVSGSRTLSKMNSFDFVVTIALGSTFAAVLVNENITLVDGLVALALLVGLQFLVTWTSVRALWVQHIITSRPILLLHQGTFIAASLRSARVTENDIRAAVRNSGEARLENVGAVILETDGSFSVIGTLSDDDNTSLWDVRMPKRDDVEP